MNYQQITDLFSHNYDTTRHSFSMHLTEEYGVGGLICTAAGIYVTKEKMDMCKQILKSNSRVFSVFRDNMKIPLVAKMSVADDPARYFQDISDIYQDINSRFLFSSENRLAAATIICDDAPRDRWAAIVDETYSIYEEMRKSHPFLISSEDIPTAALLAIKGGDTASVIAYMEECYRHITERFKLSRNTAQAVAQILALDPRKTPEEKSARFFECYEAAKASKLRIFTGPQMSILGILANLDTDVNAMMAVSKQYVDFLKSLKGFGALGVDGQARKVFALALAVIEKLSAAGQASDVALNSILNMIIDFEITMMVICVSSMISTTAVISNS